MRPIERAELIINQYRDSIIQNRKENLATLIAYHIEEAEKVAVEAYLKEQDRLQEIAETRRASLVKARAAKNKGRKRKGCD